MSSALPPAVGQPLVASLGSGCGVGAKASRMLLASPGLFLEEADFRRAGLSSTDNGRLLSCLRSFAERGWCEAGGGRWRVNAGMPSELPAFLEGAAAMRSADGPPSRARAIITMPGERSRLAAALPGTGLAHVALENTRTAFLGIASGASESLTVLSPFLNAPGIAWALDMFENTSAPRRELVVRSSGDLRPLLLANATRFRALGVGVLDYRLPFDGGGYETFHAKAVVADGRVAYVGSANLLAYEHHSMELGFVVEGSAVYPVAALVEAIRAIASPIRLTDGLPGGMDPLCPSSMPYGAAV